ncbi:MAG TPA: FixH family protein [Ramlibacter sp.]
MTSSTERSGPWWSHGYVWLVIAGPAAVIVAGFVTVWLAVRTPDPVVDADYYRRGIEINKTLAREKALLPALQGRNHAATPPAVPQ